MLSAVDHSPTTSGWLRLGGEMLVNAALILLVAWLIGVLGVYDGGTLVHVLLLVGLMLLLVGTLKARDAAAVRERDPRSTER